MSRDAARGEPTVEYEVTPCVLNCPACGHPMPMAYTKRRKVMTRQGLVGLYLHIRRCEHAGCERFRHTYHPEAEGQLVLPKQEFGLDVVTRVGELRYREHRSCPEIHELLQKEGASLSLRSVQNVVLQYDLLLSLALETLPERAAGLNLQGRAILAIDGLQPDVGHEVLWVVRDVRGQSCVRAACCLRHVPKCRRSSRKSIMAPMFVTFDQGWGYGCDIFRRRQMPASRRR